MKKFTNWVTRTLTTPNDTFLEKVSGCILLGLFLLIGGALLSIFIKVWGIVAITLLFGIIFIKISENKLRDTAILVIGFTLLILWALYEKTYFFPARGIIEIYIISIIFAVPLILKKEQ